MIALLRYKIKTMMATVFNYQRGIRFIPIFTHELRGFSWLSYQQEF